MHELHVDGPTLLLTVGPAASGKSTYLRRWQASGAIDVVVSTDTVRAELGLAPAERSTAYREARRRVRAALSAGLVVAVDATNVRPGDRAALLELAASEGWAPVVAVRTGGSLGLDALVARDAGRDRHVPHHVIAEQLRLYRASGRDTLLREGFHAAVDADEVVLVRDDMLAPAAIREPIPA